MYFCFFSITSFAQTVCSRKRSPSSLFLFLFLTKQKTEQKLRFLFGADEGT